MSRDRREAAELQAEVPEVTEEYRALKSKLITAIIPEATLEVLISETKAVLRIRNTTPCVITAAELEINGTLVPDYYAQVFLYTNRPIFPNRTGTFEYNTSASGPAGTDRWRIAALEYGTPVSDNDFVSEHPACARRL